MYIPSEYRKKMLYGSISCNAYTCVYIYIYMLALITNTCLRQRFLPGNTGCVSLVQLHVLG